MRAGLDITLAGRGPEQIAEPGWHANSAPGRRVAAAAAPAYSIAEMDTSTALAGIEHTPFVTFNDGMALDCGARLERLTVAYRTYGTLNAQRSNAVLVCHALTGDQYVAERHPITGKEGWWDIVVGPGRPLDTDRYFVICANVLGGCMGSTGPRSLRDDGHGPWGTDFPPVTIRDITRSVTLAGKTLGSTVDQRGRRHVGYEATTSLDRRQFGLTLLKESPGVGLIAGTDVAVTIDVEAVSGP